jgi:hypothetical protein
VPLIDSEASVALLDLLEALNGNVAFDVDEPETLTSIEVSTVQSRCF